MVSKETKRELIGMLYGVILALIGAAMFAAGLLLVRQIFMM